MRSSERDTCWHLLLLCSLGRCLRQQQPIYASLSTASDLLCSSVATALTAVLLSLPAAQVACCFLSCQSFSYGRALTHHLVYRLRHSSNTTVMDEEYLEPGFDANTLTVPRLRSILLAHNINYPSSAKKSQLVELFNEQVASQAKKIKSASLRVKRSSRGIVDVPSSASSVADEGDEEQEPPATVTRSSRRSTRARTEEAEEVRPTPRRSRHSTAPPEAAPTPRRPSSKHARPVEKVEEEVEDEEPEPKRPASRRSRISAVTPSARREERDDRSPFSDQNVFQSGGNSPPPPTTERRRTTTHATSEEAKRRRSRDARRRTEAVRPAREQRDGAVVPTRKTFEMPIDKFKHEQVEADEEFTPEEQQELVQAEQAGQVVPARRKTRSSASGAASTGTLAFLGAILAGFSFLWSQEKFEVGYCGVGQPSLQIAGTEIPEWADILRPECEPCPPHAICNERLETVCEPGFVLSQHPLSFGGYLPIPPSCEPDSTRARKVNAVKERAVEELREQNARYECGEAGTPDIQETDLKHAIGSRKTKSMSNEEFEDIWANAFGDILSEDEIVTGDGG